MKTKQVSLNQTCAILDELRDAAFQDKGAFIIHTGQHPAIGSLTLVIDAADGTGTLITQP